MAIEDGEEVKIEAPKFSDVLHPAYARNVWSWQTTRDCVEGEARVKTKNEFYLPMPSGMSFQPEAAPSQSTPFQNQTWQDDFLYLRRRNNIANPNWHRVPAY